MIVLALDTALGATSVAVMDGDIVLARRHQLMDRGHQEHLATNVRDAVLASGLPFSAVDRVAVTVGPGSFTGLRVGLAFAKGLALALQIPCIGIGTLEALAASAATVGVVVAAIDARRGGVYLQIFKDMLPLMPPQALSAEAAVDRIDAMGPRTVTLVGGDGDLLGALRAVNRVVLVSPDAAQVAKLAQRAVSPFPPPMPLYLRPPDAKTLQDRKSQP